ncbi:hypothetical protein [Myroides indicus]|uniref:Uncharacterized protein n=1 Tax=Myroides indicus TaxID=1323422 RepID=A0A4R7EYU5_9FLAO|nr:hypothetical protein [Myroides indicus]TDS55235.1 hypothetical protein C8P70_1236 [Myroides indicus]
MLPFIDKSTLTELFKLQILCLERLSNLFCVDKIECFSYRTIMYEGLFGKYLGKPVTSLQIKFEYLDFLFEFYLAYNQLEYYILKEGKIIKECNLEDFYEDDILVQKFIKYLADDLKDLKLEN